MKKTLTVFSAFILLCVATYAGYSYGRHEQQQELDLQLELINYSVWATDVEVDLGLLEMLNEQKNIEAKNKIEAYLDVTLASLGNYDKLAKSYPDPKIFEAIQKAKQYRQQSNNHKIHPKLAGGIKQAFSIVE